MVHPLQDMGEQTLLSCFLSSSGFQIRSHFLGFFFLVEMPDPFTNVTFGDCNEAATSLLYLLALVLLLKVVRGSQRSAKHQLITTSVINKRGGITDTQMQ